ncbi:SpoIIE family protein phosphatase [Streptomyces sp. URMC 129]|uniref:SpoIIE family protein phosphatase n=1 Tax=Streptomyces sp. URMC 129 TaxID=3423407 RepID=UPI003F1AF863
MEAVEADPGGAADGERLRLFTVTDDAPRETELLRLALHQAVAAMGGLGGLAHLIDAEDGSLRLAAAGGLPRDVAQQWERLEPDEDTAPARAARAAEAVWLPRDAPALPAGTRTPDGVTGVLAVPLPGARGPAGVLSVLAMAVPDGDRRRFVGELAAVVGERLRRIRPGKVRVPPPWWQEPSGSRLREAVHAVRVGTWRWDLRTGTLRLDEAARDMLRATHVANRWDDRMRSWLERIHPDDLPGVLEAAERAIETGDPFAAEYRLVAEDGLVGWVEVRGQTTYAPDGTPLEVSGTAWDTTAERAKDRSVSRVLNHMPDAFFVVDGTDWRVLYANQRAERLSSREPVALTGRVPWEALPGLGDVGLKERFERALETDAPVMFDAHVARDDVWYRFRLVPVAPHLAVAVADVTAERRAERAAAERTRRIEALTGALAQALTARDVAQAVADHVLPPFGASGVLVHTLVNGHPHLVGAVGYPPEYPERLRLFSEESRLRVMASDSPRFLGSREEFARAFPDLEPLVESGDKHAWAVLPLIASGRPIGGCVISYDRPRRFSDDESSLLTALSGLVAQALERARLYDTEHSRAQQLQRALLPHVLPSLPALTAAARYRPAGYHADVGGDWYDTIPLSADRVAVVIGDVMGHGLHEAMTMGRLRTAVATLTALEYEPDELLAHLNDIVVGLGGDVYATCLYAIYDPTTGICSLASAGHPPPAIVGPDGRARFADLPGGPPLGTAHLAFEARELTLAEGSLLVLYTDGLIGTPDSDLDAGMARLAALLTDYAAAPPPPSATARRDEAGWLEHLCDRLTTALPPMGRHPRDDAAVLALRTHRLPERDIAAWDLPEEPAAAGQARAHVRTQLATWGLQELVTTTELVASELVGNVIRHATGPIRLRLLRSSVLTCEVSDGSEATPRIRHTSVMDESGRGLQLVAAMTRRWGARYTHTGKSIWTEQPLPLSATEQR